MSRETGDRKQRAALVEWVDDIYQGSENFVQGVDLYLLDKTSPEEDYMVLRTWQTKLSRLMSDLNTLRRRLDE